MKILHPVVATNLPPIADSVVAEPDAPFWRSWQTAAVIFGMLVLIGVGRWLPVPEAYAADLDPVRVRLGLGIFLCIAFLWMSEALPLAITALLVPLLAVVAGVTDVKAALAPFADPLIFLFLGSFALAAAMIRHGLDRWVAQSVVRLGRGAFLRVAVLLFGGTAFISMWMSNTATAAMMLPLALGILNQVRSDSLCPRCRPFLLLGLAYSASIGGLGTVIGSPPNGIAAAQLGLTFAEWMKFGIPVVLVSMPAMIGILYLVCRPKVGLRVEINQEVFKATPQKIATIAIFAGAALSWSFGGKIAPLLGIPATNFDTVVALALIFALLFSRVITWREMDHGTDWGVLLLFGGGLALSAILSGTGASTFLARILTVAVSDWQLIGLIAAVVTFVIFLTELSSNTATAALFVPIFYSVAKELAVAPGLVVVPITLAASCAFMMPVATPPNALVFGTGWVTQREMMRAGWVLNLAFVVILTAASMVI